MFAAAIPLPVHQLPGSMLATGIRDALVESSFRAYMASPECRSDLSGKPRRLSRPRPRRSIELAELLQRIAVMEDDEVRGLGGRGSEVAKRLERLARRREEAWLRAGGRP